MARGSRYTLNLQYVLHSGDVTNWGERDTPQLDMASEAIKRLEQVKLPYMLTVGNHDTRAVCAGGSACPGEKAWETVRQLPAFNRYFNARFSNGGVAGQFAAGDLSNVYSTFEAGGLKWLVMSLELWPRAEVLTWADGIIKSMPTRNVIIVTHSFLNSGGAIRADNGGYGISSPATIYEKVIKYNPNVRFVFSGHEGTRRASSCRPAATTRSRICRRFTRLPPIRCASWRSTRTPTPRRVSLPRRTRTRPGTSTGASTAT